MKYRKEKNRENKYLLMFLFIIINLSLQASHIDLSKFSVSLVPDENIMCYKDDLPFDSSGDLSYLPEKDDSLHWKQYSKLQLFEMFDKNYCPKCGFRGSLTPEASTLPGIHAKNCGACGAHYTCNFLESGDDIIECPDGFKFDD